TERAEDDNPRNHRLRKYVSMARAAKTTTKDVESLKHREARRKHIPTTELESLVSDEERAPKTIRYKRNTDLDPQLVWRGKDEQDSEDLMVDSVPIYIQEKIKPEKIIGDLKRRTKYWPDEVLKVYTVV